MKVREVLNQPSNVSTLLPKDERKANSMREPGFQAQLKRLEEKNVDERVQELVNRILEQGSKLSEKVDIRELKVYKQMIAQFLDEALGNSQKFSKESFLDRRGRYKVYATIRKINTHLDELTQDVLKAEKDHIGILQKIDDIRGLILDILM